MSFGIGGFTVLNASVLIFSVELKGEERDFSRVLPVLCQDLAENLGLPDSLIQIPCHMPSHHGALLTNAPSFNFRQTVRVFLRCGCDVPAQSVFSVSPKTVRRIQSYSISLMY